MIGPPLFTACLVIQGLARRGECDPIADRASALEAGSNGWMQQLNVIVLGLPLNVAVARFVLPESAPLHPWAGLGQRVVLAVWFPCLVALVTRLWRLESPSLSSEETGGDRWT